MRKEKERPTVISLRWLAVPLGLWAWLSFWLWLIACWAERRPGVAVLLRTLDSTQGRANEGRRVTPAFLWRPFLSATLATSPRCRFARAQYRSSIKSKTCSIGRPAWLVAEPEGIGR